MTTYHARLTAPLGLRSREEFAAEVDALPGDLTRGPVGDVQGQTGTVLVSFEATDEVDANRTVADLVAQLDGAQGHLVDVAE